MTRGTIAFIYSVKDIDKYFLAVSPQFNGDMGPHMANGKKLIEYFRNIYLNKKNHLSKREKMERIVMAMIDKFKYDYEKDHVRLIPLEKSADGNFRIDLRTKYLNPNTKDIDFKNDVWSSWFDYSDYLYIVPLCDAKNIIVVEENEDHTTEEHRLLKDYMDVYCFRSYVGFVNRKNGKYYGFVGCKNGEYYDMDSEEAEDSEDENFLENYALEPRYVEIISQYRDGDRDCLVVRTVDNKHILFKEMK